MRNIIAALSDLPPLEVVDLFEVLAVDDALAGKEFVGLRGAVLVARGVVGFLRGGEFGTGVDYSVGLGFWRGVGEMGGGSLVVEVVAEVDE